MASRYATGVGDTKRPLQVRLGADDWSALAWILEYVNTFPELQNRSPVSMAVRYAIRRAAQDMGWRASNERVQDRRTK